MLLFLRYIFKIYFQCKFKGYNYFIENSRTVSYSNLVHALIF